MKRRFLLPLALLLLAAMLLPCPVIAEDLSLVNASAVDEINNPNVDLQPEELPEFQLDAPDADDSDTEHTAVEVAVMAAPADESNVESASADVPKAAVPTKLTLGVKEKYALKVSGVKKYASSNKQIATVSNKGVIQGKKTGTAKITVTYKSGKKTTVKVTVKAAPGKVTLNKKKATLNAGKTLQLKATLPGKTTSCKMTWSSSNKKVAKVDTKGKVTALKAGTAKITVTTFNGKKATCTVTVKKVAVPSKVTIVDYFDETLDSIDLEINEEYELYASVTPENATTTLTWSSSDDYVASVSDDGVVTGIDEGEAIITVETSNGKKANCIVVVAGPNPTPTPTPTPTLTPIPTPTPNHITVSENNITVNADDKYTIKVSCFPYGSTVRYSISDKDIASCEWSNDWIDNVIDLYITGKKNGIATITVTNEDTNDSVKVTVTVIDNRVEILLPDTPITIGEYWGNRIMEQCEITDIYYTFEKDSYKSDQFKVKIYMAGTKTYDEDGENHSSSQPISYKLYDIDGVVVGSGSVIRLDLAVGEKWKATSCCILHNLPSGTYTLKILDTVY